MAALRGELDSLRQAIDEMPALEGEALAKRLAAVSEKLNNWPQPTRLVEELKERLEQVERQVRKLRKTQADKDAAASQEAAHALFTSAERHGDIALVVGELNGASSQQLRAAAVAILQKASSAAVFLAAAHEGKVSADRRDDEGLLQRGLDAGTLVESVAPIVGGRAGAGPRWLSEEVRGLRGSPRQSRPCASS